MKSGQTTSWLLQLGSELTGPSDWPIKNEAAERLYPYWRVALTFVSLEFGPSRWGTCLVVLYLTDTGGSYAFYSIRNEIS